MEVFEINHCEENLSVIKRLYENNRKQPESSLEDQSEKIPEKVFEDLTDFDPTVVKRLEKMGVIFKSLNGSWKLNTSGMAIAGLYQEIQEMASNLP